MGLETIPRDAARVGFYWAKQFGALENVTLHLAKTQTYSYELDKMTESGGQDLQVEGLFYSEMQTQQLTSTNETVFLIKGEDAPAGVREADSLTRQKTGEKWQIFRVDPIPTEAVIKLWLRR